MRESGVWCGISEAGPWGRSETTSVKAEIEVEVFRVTIPRRAHLTGSVRQKIRRAVGKIRFDPKKSLTIINDGLCMAIRDTGNLVIEVGTRQVSTNHFISVEHPKLVVDSCSTRAAKRCLRKAAPQLNITPLRAVRSPVLWFDGADTGPIDPWKLIDAEKSVDKSNVRPARQCVAYSQAHA